MKCIQQSLETGVAFFRFLWDLRTVRVYPRKGTYPFVTHHIFREDLYIRYAMHYFTGYGLFSLKHYTCTARKGKMTTLTYTRIRVLHVTVT